MIPETSLPCGHRNTAARSWRAGVRLLHIGKVDRIGFKVNPFLMNLRLGVGIGFGTVPVTQRSWIEHTPAMDFSSVSRYRS